MKGVLLLLAAVVALIAVVTVVGAMLPESHTASRSARFNQSQEAIWNAISDFGASPSWRDDVREVQQLPDIDGHPVWREVYKDGSVLTLQTIEAWAPHRLVRRVDGSDLQIGGSWIYEVVPSNGGTQLTITEQGEVHNPIIRFVSRFVIGHKASLDSYLKALGRKFGEEVSITE
jgi:hypothetical protein